MTAGGLRISLITMGLGGARKSAMGSTRMQTFSFFENFSSFLRCYFSFFLIKLLFKRDRFASTKCFYEYEKEAKVL